MCRHLAYLGPPATLRSVIIDPPHGLYKQAWAPRLQRHGKVNADGFGVGWYAVGDPDHPSGPGGPGGPGHPGGPGDPEPARYRRAGPIWGDECFADLARVTRAGAILAAVRNATPGTDHGTAAIAPFASGPWLFSHNGKIDGWPESAAGLAATLPADMLLSLEARVDSALIWALVLRRLRLGLAPAEAFADTIGALRAASVTGRFNFLLTDGHVIAATAAGDSLWYRRGPGPSGASGGGLAVVVASEPGDDEPGWTEVADGSVITVSPQQVSVTELDPQARPHQETAGNPTTTDGRIAIR